MTQLDISLDSIASVQEMTGLDAESAKKGLGKYGSVEALANAYFDDNFSLSVNEAIIRVPPGTPSIDSTATSQQHDQSQGIFGPSNDIQVDSAPPPSYSSTAIVPFVPHSGQPTSSSTAPALIDLTGDDDTLSANKVAHGPANTSDDDQLQRALKMSTEQDSDLNKALELSMSDLKEAPSVNPVDAVKPQDRVRQLDTPVVLRSESPLLSALASFLQCLYAVPTWRKAVLDYRPLSSQVELISHIGYADFWKGSSRDPSRGTSMHDREGHWGVYALQRLFVFMHETRRSFVNITEITKLFGPEVTEQLSKTGADQASMLRALQQSLIQCIGQARRNYYAQQMGAQKMTDAEARARLTADISRFSYSGHEIDSKYISAPVPPLELDDKGSVEVTILGVKAFGSAPEDLYTAIDATFLPAGIEGTYNLLATVPETLTFKIERRVEEVVDLDSFGSDNKRQLFQPLETIYLDRYHARNRKRIYEGRAKIQELRAQLARLRESRQKLAVTKDGQDGVELLESSIKYLEVATSADVGRRNRQKRLAEQYTAVLAEMKSKIAEYDTSLDAINQEIKAVFDADDMKRVGPYELRAILMRNGLNGRGSSWAVVKGDDNRWWRSSDMSMEPTTLEDALRDTSGLHMSAGATLLFYQHKGFASTGQLEMPEFLKEMVLLDNHAFAAELPEDVSASWSLPPAPEMSTDSPPDLLMYAAPGPGEKEPVEVISLPLDAPPSPTPVDLSLPMAAEDDLMQLEQLASPISPRSSRNEDPYDVKIQVEEPEHIETVLPPAAVEVDEPMRLRGGAGEDEDMDDEREESGQGGNVEGHGKDDDDDDEAEDDEIDEDEVELGLLEPMPETWDVDLAVGKVGGIPIYLDPTSSLAPEDVTCGVCGSVMALLLQVNSPDDERPHAAARALYLFGCRTSDCVARNGRRALKVWRSQMPSPNAFYPHTAATQARRSQLETTLAENGGLASAPPTKAATWPEWDIVAESEPYEESYLPDTVTGAGEREEGTEDAAEPDTKTGVDKAFLIFQERIERVPEQVLRFYRLPDVEDPQPLWANDRKVSDQEVPPCSICHGPRQIEFQVVSTLLNFLQDDNLSFDSLLVYTCVENCPIPPRLRTATPIAAGAAEREMVAGWAEECVVDQAFAAEGMRFNLGPGSGP